eukprot:14269395-Alexandrium_andersonii.AAC.1
MCWLEEVLRPTHTPFAQAVVSLRAVASYFFKWTISAKLQMGKRRPCPTCGCRKSSCRRHAGGTCHEATTH